MTENNTGKTKLGLVLRREMLNAAEIDQFKEAIAALAGCSPDDIEFCGQEKITTDEADNIAHAGPTVIIMPEEPGHS